VNRRDFVRSSVGVFAGAALSGPLVDALTARLAAGTTPRGTARGYGPLKPKRPISAVGVDDTIEWLALPPAFTYAVFGVSGTEMTDGRATPYAHDGMGLFPITEGRFRLVRNHEVQDSAGIVPPLSDENVYDDQAGGGTTTLEVEIDPDGIPTVVRDFVSLSGTFFNCAGGVTPWGTWLSCEEDTVGPPEGFGKKHGYVFEVPAAANRPADPVPLTALGRFEHEAVAVDPDTGVLYQTEDGDDSGFFRFVPKRVSKGRPSLDAGRLQMLKVVGEDDYDARTGQDVGRTLKTEWVDIDDPDPDEGGKAVYEEGRSKGGAMFRRLEGCVFDRGAIHFTSTDGGDEKQGQVWTYRPRGRDRGRLTLLYESPGADAMSSPDNIGITPRGGILICEDTPPGPEQRLQGLTREGDVFELARNIADPAEWAGPCWSPNGEYLFVNTIGNTLGIEGGHTSRTYAIWGPWERGAL
jgi:secreted PhoX family phosphatase